MYKYVQRDRASFKEKIWLTLKHFSISANTFRQCMPVKDVPICEISSLFDNAVLNVVLFEFTCLSIWQL